MGLPLNTHIDQPGLYSPGTAGYTDYPAWQGHQAVARGKPILTRWANIDARSGQLNRSWATPDAKEPSVYRATRLPGRTKVLMGGTGQGQPAGMGAASTAYW
ncbi:hypothetical protein GZL_09292 [Streptomyces sp. 769]|nr:hypothetical protein GZL_09292 [Streptomyces sp. 769]